MRLMADVEGVFVVTIQVEERGGGVLAPDMIGRRRLSTWSARGQTL